MVGGQNGLLVNGLICQWYLQEYLHIELHWNKFGSTPSILSDKETWVEPVKIGPSS